MSATDSTSGSAHASAYATALSAACAAAAGQNYPPGALYVVATPIGNLADISLRALHVLQLADTVGCEDTRHTQVLLRAYGINKAASQLLAVHQHNEAQAAHAVIERLQRGERVAYASDAGTPAISDPGARLVAAVRQAGHSVVPVPGASSVTTALSVAGLADEGLQSGGFVFVGFLSPKASERASAIAALRRETRPVVLLEAPHRIDALAQALTSLGQRQLTVGRELTKQFEEIASLAADGLADWLQRAPHRNQGEFVLVLHATASVEDHGSEQRILQLLLAELPLARAVKLTCEITGAARKAVYQAALALKQGML